MVRLSLALGFLLLGSLACAESSAAFERGVIARAGGDHASAAFHFLEAAEAGHPPAQRELGRLYLLGNGVERSGAQAARWLQRAAEKGDAEAMLLVGRLYAQGELVEASRIRARYWLEKALAAGKKEAQELLATLPEPVEAAAPTSDPERSGVQAERVRMLAVLRRVNQGEDLPLGERAAALRTLRGLPPKESTRCTLGYFLLNGGLGERDPEAGEAMLRAEIAKGSSRARNALAFHFAETGTHLDEGLELIEAAVTQEPERPEYLDTKAWLLHGLGRDQEAEALLRRALTLEGASDTVRRHLELVQARPEAAGGASR